MTDLQTVQSELHTAPLLIGPEMTQFVEKPGQAKKEVSEYIQPDLHFIFQQLKQRVVKGSTQSCYLDLLRGRCFYSYPVPQSLPSPNFSPSFTPHLKETQAPQLPEVTGSQENRDKQKEIKLLFIKEKTLLTIMEFNHHSRHHEICKRRYPKKPQSNKFCNHIAAVVKMNHALFRSKKSKSGK